MIAFTPEWLHLTTLFVFGTIIGSFLNVYLYRFHTGKSLSGRSHCLSCARPLAWFELLPLLSYLGLRGRCRTCGSLITPRYFLVEFATATLFVLSGLLATSSIELALLLCVSAVVVCMVVYDLAHFIIPDEFVLTLAGLAVALEVYALTTGSSFTTVGYDLLAAAAVTGFFGSLWAISHGRWLGFGDVKLVAPLVLMVGVSGAFSFVVLSFWVGAALSLLLMFVGALWRWGKTGGRFFRAGLTMKSEVPFAPFLIVGFLLVFFGGYSVLTLLAHVY